MCVCFYCEFGRCCFEMFGIGFPEMDTSRYVWNYPVWIRDRKEMDRKLDFWQAWLITDPTVVWLNQSCWYDFVCLKGVKCQSHFPNFGGLGWIILWGTDVCCLHVILALRTSMAVLKADGDMYVTPWSWVNVDQGKSNSVFCVCLVPPFFASWICTVLPSLAEYVLFKWAWIACGSIVAGARQEPAGMELMKRSIARHHQLRTVC